LNKNSFESKEELSPLFERFFILGGPRGLLQKNLQKKDSDSEPLFSNLVSSTLKVKGAAGILELLSALK
jgi:hypothetical protein